MSTYEAPLTLMQAFAVGMDKENPVFKDVQCTQEQFHNGEIVMLNLGAGNKEIVNAHPIDWPHYNFEEPDSLNSFRDDSVDAIFAFHVLEHLSDPRKLLRECGRVLKPGAPITIVVPHAKAEIAFQDLDHKSFFVSDTWKVLLDSQYYTKGKNDFPFVIGANIICGLNERNTVLVTQLIKEW